MSILVLSTQDKQLISKAVGNTSNVEASDKELFLFAYKTYKSVLKKQRGSITGILNKEVEKSTKSINIGNTLKRVFKCAFNYVDMSVICCFDKLEYTNINNLVRLFKYVDTNLSDKASELREEIKGLHSEGVSDYRYNNIMADKIKALKEEYKLKEVEGEFKVVEFFDTVKSGIEKLNEAQLGELLDMINDKFDEVPRMDVA